MHLVVERGAPASGRLGVLALGVEDEGAALIAQQMRDDQRDALARARAGHDQHMLVGFEKRAGCRYGRSAMLSGASG